MDATLNNVLDQGKTLFFEIYLFASLWRCRYSPDHIPNIVCHQKRAEFIKCNAHGSSHGIATSNVVYGLFALAAVATILYGIVAHHFPLLSLIALLPFPLAVFALRGAITHGGEIGLHPRYLGANVALALLAPALLGIALIYG